MRPFLTFLFSPSREPKGIMPAVLSALEFIDPRPPVALGIALIALVVVSRGLWLVATTYQLRFVFDAGYRLARRILTSYLSQPYSRLVNVDVTQARRHVLQEGEVFAGAALRPLLQIGESSVTLIAIAVVLMRVSTRAALAIFLILGLAYSGFYVVRRARIHRIGASRMMANQERSKVVADVFGGLKEIKVAGLEDEFVRRFSTPSQHYARLHAENQILQGGSQYIIEAIAVSVIVGAVVHHVATGRSAIGIAPAVGFFVFGTFRMLPALHRLLASATQFRFYRPTFDAIAKDLSAELASPAAAIEAPKVEFREVLRADHVSLVRGSRKAALVDVSIAIPKGTSLALIGKTGAGKSTLAEVLMGLMEPTSGRVLVDGAEITPTNVGGWQRQIGYVPQRIYLSDDTISANVAFGVAEQDIDAARVQEAARLANMDEFLTDLPEGLLTIIGERGVRLSGGQQQRIGIARALYRRPQFLVLDEATSDLDAATQRRIVESLQHIAGTVTVLVIAHREAAANWCDRVCVMDSGRLVAQGSFSELSPLIREVTAMTG